MGRPEKVFVLCPECDGNGYHTPEINKYENNEKVLNVCKYCEGTGHVGWQRTFEGSYGDKNE
jgi:DnaJ-class molecular chaperone|tara:strand:- start:270 stop:455 length:186 start_codon:yes stop_codon:yes gene_type:complete